MLKRDISSFPNGCFAKSCGFLLPFCSFLGYGKCWTCRKIVITTTLFALILHLFLMGLYVTYQNREDVEKTIYNLLFAFNFVTSVIKGYSLLFNNERYFKLFQFFDQEFYVNESDRHVKNLLKKLIFKTKAWTYSIFCFIGTILLITVLGPLLDRNEYRLPLANYRHISRFYTTEYLLQVGGFVSASIVECTFDSLYICCCLFITTHLKILIRNVLNVKCEKNDDKLTRRQLINVIDKQTLIISGNFRFNDVFGLVLFVQLTISTFGLCFGMMNIENPSTFAILICQLSEIIVYCFIGQKINDESSALADAFYATPWVDMRPAERKWVLAGLRQAQKPLYSRAGPMRNISHETLKSVLQTAYSFYAVLKEIKNK